MFRKVYSKHLSREKVLEQIYQVPAPLRQTLKNWLKKEIDDRDASERWAQQHPDHLKVTDAQCRLMLAAHQAGVSYRAIELIFHLNCQSGNAAQRCCWRAEGALAPSPRSRGRQHHAA